MTLLKISGGTLYFREKHRSVKKKKETNILKSTFNNIAKVNHLGPSSNYHLFKQGIRPEWEDESNAEGGKFGIQFPKNKAGEAINDYWMYLVC